MNIEEFEKLKKHKNHSVVIFSAAWCQPCKALKKSLEAKIDINTIIILDCEDNQELVENLEVSSVPTIFYLGENNCDQETGVRPNTVDEILNWIK
jgi:glutaredoxin